MINKYSKHTLRKTKMKIRQSQVQNLKKLLMIKLLHQDYPS